MTGESIEKAFGRTIGWFQCAQSNGLFLSPSALRNKYDERFSEYSDARFKDFCAGYQEGFWEEYRAVSA